MNDSPKKKFVSHIYVALEHVSQNGRRKKIVSAKVFCCCWVFISPGLFSLACTKEISIDFENDIESNYR
jgi:hypothetical protein